MQARTVEHARAATSCALGTGDEGEGPRRGLALLVNVAVALALAGDASASSLTPRYSRRLLVSVEGRAADVGRATSALAAPTALHAGAPPTVLFEAPAIGDACPDRGALTAETPMRRVLVVAAPSPSALAGPDSEGGAWDDAYRALAANEATSIVGTLAAEHVRVAAIEPHLVWIDEETDTRIFQLADDVVLSGRATHGIAAEADRRWPRRDDVGWHLTDAELEEGRRLVEAQLPQQTERVTIAHFDTGFTPCREEPGLPARLVREESWDFTRTSCAGGDCRPTPGGEEHEPTHLLRSRGHGTGTLSILAGAEVSLPANGSRPAFEGPLGGAPFARVVEYRLTEFVAIWDPSVVAAALDWASERNVDVVSMSLGGPPSFTLHAAVNQAYCRGIAMFTAAGNNLHSPFLWSSSPRTTVFPARYDRVVSVVGATADDLTYARAPWRLSNLLPWTVVMRGNAGPRSVMDETLAAWTPNVPWLVFRDEEHCGDPPAVRLNGSGTSAATPQVAAAAAQWLQYHRDHPFLRSHWRSWPKAEAVYQALERSADKTTPSQPYNRRWFGSGIVRAATAIRSPVPEPQAPRRAARLQWDWLASLLLDSGPGLLAADDRRRTALRNMVRTELAQLSIASPEFEAVVRDLDGDGGVADARTRRRIVARLAADGSASATVRAFARDALERRARE